MSVNFGTGGFGTFGQFAAYTGYQNPTAKCGRKTFLKIVSTPCMACKKSPGLAGVSTLESGIESVFMAATITATMPAGGLLAGWNTVGYFYHLS